MYPFQVVYHESSRLAKSTGTSKKGNVDGIITSKELEALILEKNSEGYELQTVIPVMGLLLLLHIV